MGRGESRRKDNFGLILSAPRWQQSSPLNSMSWVPTLAGLALGGLHWDGGVKGRGSVQLQVGEMGGGGWREDRCGGEGSVGRCVGVGRVEKYWLVLWLDGCIGVWRVGKF